MIYLALATINRKCLQFRQLSKILCAYHPMVEQRFINYWQKQRQQQAVQLKLLKNQAWLDVQCITQLLNQEFEITQVFIYGSLLKDRFKAESDIDIAVAGLAKERFYEAMAAINEVCDRWVDLKPIESLEPYFWQRIQSQGIWVDETTEWNQLAGTSGGH